MIERIAERGRTMLETLTVVAIAAVLTLGGLVGYQMAMQMHAFNETIHQLTIALQNFETAHIAERYATLKVGDKVSMSEVISDVDLVRDSNNPDIQDLMTRGGGRIWLEKFKHSDGQEYIAFKFEWPNDERSIPLCRRVMKTAMNAYVGVGDDGVMQFGDMAEKSDEERVEEICKQSIPRYDELVRQL